MSGFTGDGPQAEAFRAQTAQSEAGGTGTRAAQGYHNLGRSTAAGPYGITDPTWIALARKYPGLGLSQANRFDPEANRRAKDALTQEQGQTLQASGLTLSGQNLAMLAFLGPAAGKAMLQAQPGADAYEVVKGALGSAWADQFRKSNPEIFRPGATAGDVSARALRGYGSGAGVPGTAPGGETNSALSAPLGGSFSSTASAAASSPAWTPDPSKFSAPAQGNPLVEQIALLQGLSPSFRAVKVDYDPWAVAPKGQGG